VPAADGFDPALILASAGFDPHCLDLALHCSHDGFAAMTERRRERADRYCEGRLALVLGGRDHLEALSRGVHAVLGGLAGVDEAASFHRSAFEEP
jgi:acetoin utilization deacetylase AcuC-like enzyme